MSKEIKLFGIVTISVLILIFGALIGILISLNSTQNVLSENEIILNSKDFESVGVNVVYSNVDEFEKIIGFENYIFNYEEFSRFFNTNVKNDSDLRKYLIENDYNIEHQTQIDEIFGKKQVCKFDDIYKKKVCFHYSIVKFALDQTISYDVQKFLELN